MAKTNETFNTEVFGKRNIEALDLIYTANACIMPPGSPTISGRSAIKKFWSDMIQTTNARSAVLVSDFVTPSGDNAVEIGHATLTAHPAGQAEMLIEVKYVVFWMREDGLWKWHVDIWNANS